jgi:hypothetical protein
MRKIDLFPESYSEVDEIHEPTWKHYCYYEFLKISPSYYSVHLYKNKRLHISKIKKIEQYEKVLKTYELFGDVYTVQFHDWWAGGGYKFFSPNQEFEFIFKVDLNISLAVNQEKLKSAYQSRKADIKSYLPELIFQKNKMQRGVLFNRLRLIRTLIFLSNYLNSKGIECKENTPNWFLAYVDQENIFGRVSGSSFSNIKPAIRFVESEGGISIAEMIKIAKKTKDAEKAVNTKRPYLKAISVKNTSNKSANKAKRYLSMLISKNKREALMICENAARGLFPNKEKLLSNYSNFNFQKIKESLEFKNLFDNGSFSIDSLMYDFWASSKTSKKLAADRRLEYEVQRRMMEQVDTELKDVINKRAEAIYNKKYKQIIDKTKKSAKSTQRPVSFARR